MIALLLDRDGTLMDDVGYPNDPNQVKLIPDAVKAVKELHDRFGCVPCIVSNQSGVARRLITQEQFQAVHERFIELFRQETGLTLPAYYCLHGTDEHCHCRKPRPGLLQQAIAEQNLTGKARHHDRGQTIRRGGRYDNRGKDGLACPGPDVSSTCSDAGFVRREMV